MKAKISTLFLKLLIVGLGIIALLIGGILVPMDIRENGFGPAWIFMYLAAIPFYIALWQGLKLLLYIDRGTAFSEMSVKALQLIQYCGFIMTACYLACLPWVFQAADREDAPGMILIWTAFSCAPAVIAVFAAVLKKVLQNAIALKSENDLTV